MSYTALQIANAFLDRAKKDNKPLTNMKLQKLLYFAQGHSYGLRNKRLIEDDCQAWQYGPVYPTVYRAFSRFGAGPITSLAIDETDIDWMFSDDPSAQPPVAATPKNKDVNSFLDAVWKAYKDTSAVRLSEMSHVSNGPWATAWKAGVRGAVINGDEIAKYFKKANAAAAAKKKDAAGA
jgi:uncharacterized phage-associated protein